MRAWTRRTSWLVLAVLAALAPSSVASGQPNDEFEPDVVDMRLAEPASFTMRNVLAPLSSIFVGGPGYWYDARELVIESTPPGAIIELFYIRSNFQKRYERAEAPVTLILPSRIASLERDSIRIRALVPGFRQVETSLPVHTRERRLVLTLDPLPNRVEAVEHRSFGGRASLVFLTTELPSLRVQQEDDGFTAFLAETAVAPSAEAALAGVENALVRDVTVRQLGEDLAVRVELRADARDRIELRSRQAYDPARELHAFGIDLVPADGGADAVSAAVAALGAVAPNDVRGCALAFEAELRARLDAATLSRALEPRGDFTDRYVRAAMRRLGELAPDGAVRFADGSTHRPAVPLELDVALSQAGGAEGFIALLRAFAARLDERFAIEGLRSLLAPETSVSEFAATVGRAEAAEAQCWASE